MCFRRITRNFEWDYFLAPARTIIFADGILRDASRRNASRNHSRNDRFAGGLWNTDGQWNAYLADRLLSLFMHVTMLRCVSDKISVDRSIMRDGDKAKDPVSESFRILEEIKTDTGSIFGK